MAFEAMNDNIYAYKWNPMEWMCAADFTESCSVAAALSNSSHWTIFNNTLVDHCLASSITEVCKLQYSFVVLFVVLLSNSTKLFAILWTLKVIECEHFVTIGDAIASFLSNTNHNTAGACTMTKASIQIPSPNLAGILNDGDDTLRNSEGSLV